MIYHRKWKRRWGLALAQYLRDCVVQILPIRLSGRIIKLLYGIEPKFVFLVHARRREDIFIALPFLWVIRRLLPKRALYKLFDSMPCFVLGHVVTKNGTNGIIITTTKLPSLLSSDRKISISEAGKLLRFARCISTQNAVVGLGGWWPNLTRRGAALKDAAERLDLRLTNGHTGTLCSIMMMIQDIASYSTVPQEKLSVLIMGVGKMGENVVRALHGKVGSISLYDINFKKCIKIMHDYALNPVRATNVSTVPIEREALIRALSDTHLCVCTTSNMNKVLRNDELPENVIIIDDSRPEAFSRVINLKSKKVIVEGGLLKIRGAKTNYHFGFGLHEYVFGCLGEAYIIARDECKRLKPTLGSVDVDNFDAMMKTLSENDVEIGNFKTSNISIPRSIIKEIIESKRSHVNQSSTSQMIC